MNANPVVPLVEEMKMAALVDLDGTLFVLVGLFLLLYVFLRFALFRPVLDVFAEREARIDGSRKAAEEMQKRADEALARYEAFVREARARGAELKASLRLEGQRIERELLAIARKEAEAEIARSKAELEAEVKRAEAALERQIAALGQEAATRLLSRPVRAVAPAADDERRTAP